MFYSVIWRLMISAMAKDAKPKSESESITFRVERNVLDKLRAEADST
jgi:riboflavin biosynthesis pyrimidine reductase